MSVWPDSPLSVSTRNTLNHWQLDHGDRWPDWLLWPRPHDWHGYINTEAGTPTGVLEKNYYFSASTKKKCMDIQNRILVNHQFKFKFSIWKLFSYSTNDIKAACGLVVENRIVQEPEIKLTLSPAPCWWKWRNDEWKQWWSIPDH